MRRRSEMPSEDEVLETKLWTLAKYMKELGNHVHVVCETEEYDHKGDYITREYRVSLVEDNSAELHKSVVLYLEELPRGEDTTMEAESVEGDVRSGGPTGLTSENSPPARSATADSGRSEKV